MYPTANRVTTNITVNLRGEEKQQICPALTTDFSTVCTPTVPNNAVLNIFGPNKYL